MKYQLIDRCRETFPISMMCRHLAVSSSGYYDWRKRPLSNLRQANVRLVEQIKRLHDSSDGVWGAPTITQELKLQKTACSLNRVARLMKREGLQGIPKKHRWRRKSSGGRPDGVENHLKRDFSATSPNQKWVTDITQLETGEGLLFACIVKDLFDGRIVGWATRSRQTTEIVMQAVLMATWQRSDNRVVILHSDRGTQFTSHEYQRFLRLNNLVCSMSEVGSCADNASAESFFGQLKRERINRRVYLSRAEARADVFDYIERFYNPRKLRQLHAKNLK